MSHIDKEEICIILSSFHSVAQWLNNQLMHNG